jgi:ABC-2 type transport system ATP-binding protein
MIIETEGLTKFYGKVRGVEDLNLAVKEGEVFGYLGPNGAGKTTTIRLLLDFIRPTRGQARIFGLDAHQHTVEIKQRLGNLPGELALYRNLTGAQLLAYFANLRGKVDPGYVQQLAQRLDIDLSRPIKVYSHGMKQKVGLLQALMHQPELVVLDEPTIGLDPLVQQEFYRLIAEVKAAGRTVFMSSHFLPEVERTCDRVGIIRQGHLVTVEEVTALKAKVLRTMEIHFAAPVPPEAFRTLPGVTDLAVENSILRCTVRGSVDALVKAAARFTVVDLKVHEPSLEEVFLAYYTPEGGQTAS